eukprot:scaffold731_cov261-Pinguiococcus_pyrenoidosus.AAC.64
MPLHWWTSSTRTSKADAGRAKARDKAVKAHGAWTAFDVGSVILRAGPNRGEDQSCAKEKTT